MRRVSRVSSRLHIGQRDGAIRPCALELRRVESQHLRTLTRGWGDSQARGCRRRRCNGLGRLQGG